jgi:hypothetical protein
MLASPSQRGNAGDDGTGWNKILDCSRVLAGPFYGYTLHFSSTGSLAVNQIPVLNLSYGTHRDFTAIGVVSRRADAGGRRTALAVRNVQEVIQAGAGAA